MPQITKRKDTEYGTLVYRITGDYQRAYRCQLKAVDFTHTTVPEPDVTYTVWGLDGWYHPCTAYSMVGDLLYHGDSLGDAWEAVMRKVGCASIPERLNYFPKEYAKA